MPVLGIEFNDAAITGVGEAGVVFSEPGYAFVDGTQNLFGVEALATARLNPRQVNNRYWHELSESALPSSGSQYETFADLAQTQLEQLWSACANDLTEVLFAVPGYWASEQLGLLLGIAEELGIPARGLVNCAVAATRRHYAERELFHIEGSLHEIGLTRISQDGAAGFAERYAVKELGIESLERACAEFFSRRFVECSRFDPLHEAKTEQMIYDKLHDWLAQLKRHDELELSVAFDGYDFVAKVESRELDDYQRKVVEPLVQKLRSLLAGQPCALQVNARLGAFSGVIEALFGLPDCDVYVLEAGAAARGVLRRHQRLPSASSGIRLTTALPWDQPPVEPSPAERSGDTGQMPTHILYQGKAYRLGPEPFSIGSDLVGGAYGIALGGPNSGISRRHCTVQVEQSRLLVHDHSRYGTFLNGHRIEGSAVLQQGDALSVGQPMETLQLIAEVAGNGA